jgi:exodeoxyribonuclease VIII
MIRRAALDIETLDLAPTAVILSIGVAVFAPSGEVVDTFYSPLRRDDQEWVGRTTNADTLAWWQQQSPEARAILHTKGTAVHWVLEDLSHFLTKHQVEGVYGWGADFDNATVRCLARSLGQPEPWHYRMNRCGRTVVALAGNRIVPPERVGTHHNALDDAIFQARHIASALRVLTPEQ